MVYEATRTFADVHAPSSSFFLSPDATIDYPKNLTLGDVLPFQHVRPLFSSLLLQDQSLQRDTF